MNPAVLSLRSSFRCKPRVVWSRIRSKRCIRRRHDERTVGAESHHDCRRRGQSSRVGQALREECYRFVDTADGTRVLELIEQEKPGLVLLDIWMPQIDGIDLLKQIKSKEPAINVVMISGHGSIHTAVAATKSGA